MSMNEEKQLRKYGGIFREELLGNVAPFWLEHGADSEAGGIRTFLDRKGSIYSSDKSVWMQGRTAWMYSHLCSLYGTRPEWLSMAKSCLDFLNAHCIDRSDGRMYFTVTRDGRPVRRRRYFFSETFYIIGSAEYAFAAGDKEALENARQYYEMFFGLCHDPENSPIKTEPKFYPETRKLRSMANPMIMLNVTQVMRCCDRERAAYYDERMRLLCEDILKYHYHPEIGFLLENAGPCGEFVSDVPIGRIVSPGHDMEACWFLCDAAETLGDEGILKAAEDIYSWAKEKGWDREYGGMPLFIDALGFPPEAYEHDMKHWWGQNESVIAALTLYRQTGERKYLDDFIMFTDYAFGAYSDHEYGEWYGYLRRDGKPTEPACKGGQYKGPFHVPRMLARVERMIENILADGVNRIRGV